MSGCSAGDAVLAPLSLSTSSQAGAVSPQSGDLSEPRREPTVTDRQRGFLEALAAVGVTPSSELHALSIGSYVCQARAAGQNDQAVWDFVVPLVRNEVRAAHPNEDTLPAGEVESVTADYIRVATERLC